MSPPGVEPVLPSWKVGVVTALPPSSLFHIFCFNYYLDGLNIFMIKLKNKRKEIELNNYN